MDPPPPRIRRHGLRLYLVLLLVALLAPALALGAAAVQALAVSYRHAFEGQLLALARSISVTLDETLDAHLAVGRILAGSPRLAAGDLAGFEAEARLAAEGIGSWVSLIAPGPDHRRLVHTGLPAGGSPGYGGLVLPAPQAPIPRVFATGQARVTNVGQSIALGRPTALVLVPVLHDGATVQVIGLGFEPARVARLLAAHAVGGQLSVSVVDGRQRVLAHSARHEEFAGREAPAWQAGTAEARIARGPSLDGEEAIAAVARLSRADWSVVVSAPAAAAAGAVREPLLLILGGGVALLALAACLAAWMARRVVRPIRLLADAARSVSLGVGGSLASVPPAPVAEVEVLRRALLRAELAQEERAAREEADAARLRLLTRELSHRVKNALAVVQAALRLTPRDDAARFVAAVEGRVAALARANAILAESSWRGADLEGLIRAELEPFRTPEGSGPRVVLDGPAVTLAPTAVQPLAIAVHELATNAVKYGALSVPEGRLDIAWSPEQAGGLRLTWAEAGLPTAPPRRTGFGTRVLDATLRGQLGGGLQREWRPAGLLCVLELPPAVLG